MINRTLIGAWIVAATPVAFAAGSPTVDAISGRCATGGDRQQVECLSQQIDRLNGDLDRAYRGALARLPEQNANDTRGSRDQLRKSEASWLQYKETNCALMGALQGGSNLWITHFAQICDEQEIQARTRLLMQIADGSVGNR